MRTVPGLAVIMLLVYVVVLCHNHSYTPGDPNPIKTIFLTKKSLDTALLNIN